MRLSLLFLAGTISFAFSGEVGQETTQKKAWAAWSNGRIAEAAKLAETLVKDPAGADEGNHLLFLTASVCGKYDEALKHRAKIRPTYADLAKTDRPAVTALCHLGQYKNALDLAKERKLGDALIHRLSAHAQAPLARKLDGLARIPFTDDPLSAYFPGLLVKINDKEVTARIDTGANFIVLSPRAAEFLKIDMTDLGEKAMHGSKATKSQFGIAKNLQIGNARLDNVPVLSMASLEPDAKEHKSKHGFIIIGTNVLQQFLSTLDYPNKRLLLSPRGNSEATKEHVAQLPKQQVEMTFYLWDDHYMFAQGRIGTTKGTYFVDSGLVHLHNVGKRIRQACFSANYKTYANAKLKPEQIKFPVFDLPVPLALGPLEQKDCLVVTGNQDDDKAHARSFGGVRMDGLISHAFLCKYSWTIDFDKHQYRFGIPQEESKAGRSQRKRDSIQSIPPAQRL